MTASANDRARLRLTTALEAQQRALIKCSTRDADDLLTAGIAVVDAGQTAHLLREDQATTWKRRLYAAAVAEHSGDIRPGSASSVAVPDDIEYVATYVFTPQVTIDGFFLHGLELFSSFFALRWISQTSSARSRSFRVHVAGTQHESVAAHGSSFGRGAIRGETLFVPAIADAPHILDVYLVGPAASTQHGAARRA